MQVHEFQVLEFQFIFCQRVPCTLSKITVDFSNLLKSSGSSVFLCHIQVFVLFLLFVFCQMWFCFKLREYPIKLNLITSEDEGASFSEKL